ncbi:sensor histidine kinase [Paenibacillus tarimensis]
MSVRRKLFIAMASFIIGMGLVYAFLTLFVVRGILDFMLDTDRSQVIEELTGLFEAYYENNESWDGVEHVDSSNLTGKNSSRNGSVLLMSVPGLELLYCAGEADTNQVTAFGIRSIIQIKGQTAAYLYYYDQEVAGMAKMRIAVRDAVTILLFAGAVILVLLSLAVAYWLSKRLTAPLRVLLPAIDRLGKGQYGVQAPVISKDEYGKVAEAFNDMSKQLQRAEEVRRNLAADVAHELRTPITIIRGKLDLIQQRGRQIPPESLLPLQDDLIRLTRLVDDLHQLSLAEAKKLPLDRKPTNMQELMERIVERMIPDAEAKGIEITFECKSEYSRLNVDPNRITQVFLNLLVNAVRYTREGGTVRLTMGTITNAQGSWLRITVADSGIGIAPGHLPFLFNRFYRTDNARTRNSGGMGLGLAIAKEFVHAHQGTIDVESEPGQGTIFTVMLPIEKLC